MNRNRYSIVASLGAVLAIVFLMLASATAKANGKNGTKKHNAHGKVVAVTAARDGSGSITIVTHTGKGKQGAAAAAAKAKPVTKTFQIGPNTIYQAVTTAGTNRVTLAAIRRGERVAIASTNGPADEVDIMMVPKKHKPK